MVFIRKEASYSLELMQEVLVWHTVPSHTLLLSALIRTFVSYCNFVLAKGSDALQVER